MADEELVTRWRIEKRQGVCRDCGRQGPGSGDSHWLGVKGPLSGRRLCFECQLGAVAEELLAAQEKRER